MSVHPARSQERQYVTWGDKGGRNFIGIEWVFGQANLGVQCIAGNCGGDGLQADFYVNATLRLNGRVVCNEQQRIDALRFSGTDYYLCNGRAVIRGNKWGGNMEACYYPVSPPPPGRGIESFPDPPSGCVTSPAHCDWTRTCSHYWNANF
jgi:hypothetical protein